MTSRRKFIQQGSMAALGLAWLPSQIFSKGLSDDVVMTVSGPIHPSAMKLTLTHEHVLADLIGAKEYSKSRYNAEEVFAKALPHLQDVRRRGCITFVDCSPAYLGRDVQLLLRLAKASGLQIITNTGYYGAVGEKFLPAHAYTETAEQIAARWIDEWNLGIEGTGIKPGFIKTSVDEAPLTPTQRKIIDAAALTHLATGLTIGIHTGNGNAADEQLAILAARGVSPQARIWIHAQNEKSEAFHINTAKQKGWVSFDGINPETLDINLAYLQIMKREKLLDYVLLSQDSGWYNVGEPEGGNFKNYNCLFTQFIPLLKQNGFTQAELERMLITNPAKAFAVKVRKL